MNIFYPPFAPSGPQTFQISLSGATTPTGVVANATVKHETTETGLYSNTFVTETGRAVIDGLTETGEVVVAKTETFTINLAGSVSPSASLTKSAGKTLAGILSSNGVLSKFVSALYSGISTPVAVVTRLLNRTLTGSVSPSGAVTNEIVVPLPQVRGVGALSNSSGAVTPAMPTGILAGDILLFFGETIAGEAITLSGGTETWAEVPDSPVDSGPLGGVNSVRLTMFWARASQSNPTSPTTNDPGNHITCGIIAFSGCVASGNPWDVTSSGITDPGNTAISVPGDTTAGPNRLVVVAVATDRDSSSTTTFSGWTNGDLTNIVERVDQTFIGAAGGGLGIATGEKASAGVYGATSVTQATAELTSHMTVALRPTAAAGGPFTVDIAGSVSPTATIIRSTDKILVGVSSPSGTALKALSRLLAGSITPSAVLGTLKVALRTFTGALSSAGQLTRIAQKTIAGTTSPNGSLLKQVAKVFIGIITPTGVVDAIKLAGTFFVNLAGSINPSAVLRNFSQKVLSGTVSPNGILVKRMSKAFQGLTTPSGVVASIKTLLRAFAGTMASSGALTRRVGKVLGGLSSPDGTVRRSIGKVLSGGSTPSGGLIKTIARTLIGLLTSSGSASHVKIDATLVPPFKAKASESISGATVSETSAMGAKASEVVIGGASASD